ncbi:MAG: hypothetical protein J6R27_00940 [Muribaculaceae bacterium]|nr:hypothetical protein [Muribaculaceae bacterium]
MAESDIITSRPKFVKLLSLGRIFDAIKLLRNLSEKNLSWELTDKIDKAESSYKYLLQYAIDGVNDPQRPEIYNSIIESLTLIYDQLTRLEKIKSQSSIYYTTTRRGNQQSVKLAIESYLNSLRTSDAFAQILDSDNSTLGANEPLEINIFDAVWTQFPLSRNEADAIKQLLCHEAVPEYVKRLTISAIMLGDMEYADERRILILADTYADNPSSELGAIAMTALLLSLYMNRERQLSRPARSRLEMLRDIPSWRNDIKTAFLELIRTRDTERISRKLTDEIVPEMLKMKPEIDKKISSINITEIDPAELEENPEWQEILEESGIADKLKELTELQEEGGDVMMGTFSHLKSFPFFHYVANWFLPFHSSHSLVAQLGEIGHTIGEMIECSPFMCDSDKYSFILAINDVPQAQREFMTQQIKSQNLNFADLQAASLNLETDDRRNVINKYVQNLYRFFRLFRRKGDFTDPFATGINLTLVPLLADDLTDGDTLQLVAEFYFRRQYYKEALDVFRIIEAHSMPDARLYQKLGYCEQKLGDNKTALQYYEQAELLDSSSIWLIKRIAKLHELNGDYNNALVYYNRLDAMQPDTTATIASIGYCQLLNGAYDDAVKAFYQVDYMKPSDRNTRALAWSLMMSQRFDDAAKEFGKLLEMPEPQADDYLNAGHLLMAMGKYHDALERYKRYALLSDNNLTAFLNAMRADTPDLLKIGVPAYIIPLAIDAVAYSLPQKSND